MRELLHDFGGCAPADRVDLIPYAGKHCRSGWCTVETSCTLLLTEGGGQTYELGVGKVAATPGRRPSTEEMKALLLDESTRFVGRAEREKVCQTYFGLRDKVEDYEANRLSYMVRAADSALASEDSMEREIFRTCITLFSLFCLMVFFISLFLAGSSRTIKDVLLTACTAGVCVILYAIIPSRILRAQIAAFLGFRSHDSLEYTLHCSFFSKPPFRAKSLPAGGLPLVPACFLPEECKPGALTSPSKRNMLVQDTEMSRVILTANQPQSEHESHV